MQTYSTPIPPAAEPSFGDNDLLTTAQVADLTGHTRTTLQSYASYRRCQRFLGPKPTKVPGARVIFYRYADVRLYMETGATGAPGDPNHDGGDL